MSTSESYGIEHLLERLNQDKERLEHAEKLAEERNDDGLKERLGLVRENLESLFHIVDNNEEKLRLLREASENRDHLKEFFQHNSHIYHFYAEFIIHILHVLQESQEKAEDVLEDELEYLHQREANAVFLARKLEIELLELLLVLEEKHHVKETLRHALTEQQEHHEQHVSTFSPTAHILRPELRFKPSAGDGAEAED